MSAEDLEKYETEMELTSTGSTGTSCPSSPTWWRPSAASTWPTRSTSPPRNADGEVYFEVRMSDAWVWDMYRPARFVKNVRVLTFKDVNIEELDKPDLRLPERQTVRLLSGRRRSSAPESDTGGPGCPHRGAAVHRS